MTDNFQIQLPAILPKPLAEITSNCSLLGLARNIAHYMKYWPILTPMVFHLSA